MAVQSGVQQMPKTCWDYSLQNMSLIVAVKANAVDDCISALDNNAILEWLTPGYYRILGEADEDEEMPVLSKEELELASKKFPGYERNYQASNGNTALHIAAREGRIKIVKLLLKHGWSLKKRNGRNETPIETAEIHYRDKTADWLRSYQRRTRLARVIFKVSVSLRIALRKVREKNSRKRRRKNSTSNKRLTSVRISPNIATISPEDDARYDGANTRKNNDKQQQKKRDVNRSGINGDNRGSFLSPPATGQWNNATTSLENMNTNSNDKLIGMNSLVPPLVPPTAKRRSTRLNKRKRDA